MSSGDVFGNGNDARFSIANVLNLPNETYYVSGTQWILSGGQTGEFILNLGCTDCYSAVELVNSYGYGWSTKRFKVFLRYGRNYYNLDNSKKDIPIYDKHCSLFENGPWEEVIDESISDSRQQEKPLPFQKFNFDSVTARFVKFEVLSWYGAGGGLQYFNVLKTGKQGKIQKK